MSRNKLRDGDGSQQVRNTHGKLFIDDTPLQILPELAVAIGLNDAIILQQLHYWSDPKKGMGIVLEGMRWISNSYEDWQETNFPFFTIKQIGDAFRRMEKSGIIRSRTDLNASPSDKKKSYAIAYSAPIVRKMMGEDIDVEDTCRYVEDTCRYVEDTCRYVEDTCRYVEDTCRYDVNRNTETTTENTAKITAEIGDSHESGGRAIARPAADAVAPPPEDSSLTGMKNLGKRVSGNRQPKKELAGSAAPTDRRVWAMVTAYHEALKVDDQSVPTRTRHQVYKIFAGLPSWVGDTAVRGCIQYIQSDPFWREPGRTTADKVAKTILEWDAAGRPTSVVGKGRGNTQAVVEVTRSYINQWDGPAGNDDANMIEG